MDMTTTFRVGRRFKVEASFRDGGLHFEWDPHLPKRGEINKRDLADYVRGRNIFVAEIAAQTGINIMVIDA